MTKGEIVGFVVGGKNAVADGAVNDDDGGVVFVVLLGGGVA